MPDLPHLLLPRAEVELERRKRPGFGTSTPREPAVHSHRIKQAVEETLQSHERLRGTIVDPHLILRVGVSHAVPEDQWERAGLAVLGQERADSIILFSSDKDLQEFRRRLDAYGEGPLEHQKHPQYDSLIGAIEELRPLQPQDRIGPGFRAEGFMALESFDTESTLLVDVELWDVGTQDERAAQVIQLDSDVIAKGRRDRGSLHWDVLYRRFVLPGAAASFDGSLRCPVFGQSTDLQVPDLEVAQLLETTIAEIAQVAPPYGGSPMVAIIDSGHDDGHPILQGVVIERTSVPETLGLSDEFGHGSKVSGLPPMGMCAVV